MGLINSDFHYEGIVLTCQGRRITRHFLDISFDNDILVIENTPIIPPI